MGKHVTTDTSELRTFAVDLHNAAASIAPKVEAVLSKGALNIKTAMQAELKGNEYFKTLWYSIDYDIVENSEGMTADIGPNKAKTVGSGLKPGALGNIAYFGTSRGGGKVGDPVRHLNAEAPRFEAALQAVIDGSI